MSDLSDARLDRTVRFHTPGHGVCGVHRAPESVLRVARALDGQAMTLREGLALLQAAALGRVEASAVADDVILWMKSGGRIDIGDELLFVLIAYREP